MLLSYQAIRDLCTRTYPPMINPFMSREVINGKSAGLSCASYDVRIDHDLVLGVSMGNIMAQAHYERWSPEHLDSVLSQAAPNVALAYTMEDFDMPLNVSGQVSDKSTYARMFVSAFNTFIDPGFKGNLTVELVNHGPEPVVFKRGDPLCQILFTQLDEHTQFPYRGKYQHQTKKAHGPRMEE